MLMLRLCGLTMIVLWTCWLTLAINLHPVMWGIYIKPSEPGRYNFTAKSIEGNKMNNNDPQINQSFLINLVAPVNRKHRTRTALFIVEHILSLQLGHHYSGIIIF